MEIERTLVMVKPCGVQRGLIGRIISRFEDTGLKLVAISMLHPSREQMERHYSHLRDRDYFEGLILHMLSAKVVCMVWSGPGAVAVARKVLGATNPTEAAAGTIRGDLALFTRCNLCHASDSTKAAEEEISNFFPGEEIEDYGRELDRWIRAQPPA